MNRNHFDRPLQGNGRDSWGYGNTDLPDEPMTASDKWILVAILVFGGLLIGALFYLLWLALDAL